MISTWLRVGFAVVVGDWLFWLVNDGGGGGFRVRHQGLLWSCASQVCASKEVYAGWTEINPRVWFLIFQNPLIH